MTSIFCNSAWYFSLLSLSRAALRVVGKHAAERLEEGGKRQRVEVVACGGVGHASAACMRATRSFARAA